MKIQIGVDRGTYTFNAATRKITISGLNKLMLEQLLLITNSTTNTIIYNFADPTVGGTIMNDAEDIVITLSYNTVAMSNQDRLQIFVNYIDEGVLLMRRLLKIMESSATVDAQKRQRVEAWQPTAANFNVTAIQPDQNSCRVLAYQPTSSNLNAIVNQATAANLNATVVISPVSMPVSQFTEVSMRARAMYEVLRNKISFT